MIKSELVQRLALAFPHFYERDVQRMVQLVTDEIGQALAAQGRVELRGFGSFAVKQQQSRVGRNPRTGAQVQVPQKYVPQFRVGKELRARLNPPQ